MKTDDLIALLAAQAQPVPRHAAAHQLGLALLAALPVSIAIVALFYGLRPGLLESLGGAMAWVKILLPAAIGAGAFVAVQRLARPGVRVRGAWAGMLVPLALLWGMGLLVWMGATPEARPQLLWGTTWRTCIFNIVFISTPLFVATFVALRGLAPTRPMLTGAAAGALASGVGAALYALHCPELGAPFLAVWYVLGMAVPVIAGALLGRRLLRW